jgi:hypothetical protein
VKVQRLVIALLCMSFTLFIVGMTLTVMGSRLGQHEETWAINGENITVSSHNTHRDLKKLGAVKVSEVHDNRIMEDIGTLLTLISIPFVVMSSITTSITKSIEY